MTDSKNDRADTSDPALDALIRASANEARRAPAAPDPERAARPDDVDPSTPAWRDPLAERLGVFASVPLAIASVLAVALLALALHLPKPNGGPGGIPPGEALGIATYHLVHRIETYRRATGQLPKFVPEAWHESAALEYHTVGDRYRVTARHPGLRLDWVDGMDPERLLDAPDALIRVDDGEEDDDVGG